MSLKRAPASASLEVGHVAVRVAEALRLAETDAVDDRGVVERVGDDRVVGPEKRLEDASVRVEARAEENAVVGLRELRDGALQLLFGFKSPSWHPGLVIFILWLMSLIATGILAFTGIISTEWMTI